MRDFRRRGRRPGDADARLRAVPEPTIRAGVRELAAARPSTSHRSRRVVDVSPDERFEALYRAHYAAVLRFARRRTDPTSAEDVAPRRSRSRGAARRSRRKPLPWLYTTAANELNNRRRKARSDAQGGRAPLRQAATPPTPSSNATPSCAPSPASPPATGKPAPRRVGGPQPRRRARVAGTTRVAFAVRVSRARKRLAAALEDRRPRPRPPEPTMPVTSSNACAPPIPRATSTRTRPRRCCGTSRAGRSSPSPSGAGGRWSSSRSRSRRPRPWCSCPAEATGTSPPARTRRPRPWQPDPVCRTTIDTQMRTPTVTRHARRNRALAAGRPLAPAVRTASTSSTETRGADGVLRFTDGEHEGDRRWTRLHRAEREPGFIAEFRERYKRGTLDESARRPSTAGPPGATSSTRSATGSSSTWTTRQGCRWARSNVRGPLRARRNVHRDDAGQALEQLPPTPENAAKLGGSAATGERLADLPVVAERVDDAAEAPAVRVARRRTPRSRPPRRPAHRRVRIVDDQQHPHRAAAQRLGAEVDVRGRLVGDPERSRRRRELGDDLLVGADPVLHHGAEGGLVELDRLRPRRTESWAIARVTRTSNQYQRMRGIGSGTWRSADRRGSGAPDGGGGRRGLDHILHLRTYLPRTQLPGR